MNNKNEKENYSLGLKLLTVFLAGLLLSACAHDPLNAPCNQYASFCGTKTKINHW